MGPVGTLRENQQWLPAFQHCPDPTAEPVDEQRNPKRGSWGQLPSVSLWAGVCECRPEGGLFQGCGPRSLRSREDWILARAPAFSLGRCGEEGRGGIPSLYLLLSVAVPASRRLSNQTSCAEGIPNYSSSFPNNTVVHFCKIHSARKGGSLLLFPEELQPYRRLWLVRYLSIIWDNPSE